MIRATASAATARPRARDASARRPAVPIRFLALTLVLLSALALVGTVAVGQVAAAAERSRVWVSVDGVAFQGNSRSDSMAYVVRPTGTSRGGQAFSRSLTRDERNRGWAGFWEARRAYPDGYCVVWVEVDGAGSWHASNGNSACTAAGPTDPSTPTPTSTPTSTPTPTPTSETTATKADKRTKEPAAAPEPPAQQGEREPDTALPASAPPPSATRTPEPARPSASPPSPTPSATPSASASSTPSPSPSPTSPESAFLQDSREEQAGNARAAAAVSDDEIISPLGWVGVLGTGGLLIGGGLLMLWRRLI